MITIKNMSFSYKHTKVFDNISLNFEKGNIYGLLGENGVGKTTLLKIISGLQRCQSGICQMDGEDSYRRLPSMLEDVVFLPDEVRLPADSSPMKYITELGRFYKNYSYGSFVELMQELDVDPNRRFKEMSYGQVKKSLICCALSLRTSYVLLDEPTNGLDIPSKSDFRKILSKRADENSCIIVSTHQVKDVENLIDPIIIITNNDVLLNASIEEITKKLYFEYGAAKREDALYSEMLPGGYMNVVRNEVGEESLVNIEGLFNAVLRNAREVKALFQN